MDDFLSQFYHGDIIPQDMTSDEETGKLCEISMELKDELSRNLPEEFKKPFAEYVASMHGLDKIVPLRSFKVGFELGARFALALHE